MIDHLLCTHCTYGSSRLAEARTDEEKARVLGYSARESSIADSARLREAFRAVERLLSYELPAGTPAEMKRKHTADSAPKRYVFMPEMNGQQILAHVAYRPEDTAGRLGSYFAHLLCEPTTKPWSPLACLKAWGLSDPANAAGWYSQDRTEFLPLMPIASIEAWASTAGGWVNDETVVRFLQHGDVGTDSHGQPRIPSRWSTAVKAPQRLAMLKQIVQAVLDQSTSPAVILVAEQNVAAILFYAAIRLLPEICRQGIGFSLYEPDPTRVPVRLVASTTFCPGQTPGEWFESKAFVCDTFSIADSDAEVPFRMGNAPKQLGAYVRAVADAWMRGVIRYPDEIEEALHCGWPPSKERPTGADLDWCIRTEVALNHLLRDGGTSFPGESNNALHVYRALRGKQLLISKYQGLSSDKAKAVIPVIQDLLGGTERWAELRGDPALNRWLDSHARLDSASLTTTLHKPSTAVSDGEVIHLVARFVDAERNLPPVECQRFWGSPNVLVGVLGRIVPETVERYVAPAAPERYGPTCKALTLRLDRLGGSGSETERLRSHLRRIVDEAAENIVDDDAFLALLSCVTDQRPTLHPPSPTGLGPRIDRLYASLATSGMRLDGFKKRYAELKLWYEHGQDSQSRFEAWKAFFGWLKSHASNPSQIKLLASDYTGDASLQTQKLRVEQIIAKMIPEQIADHRQLRKKVVQSMLDQFKEEKWLTPRKHQELTKATAAWF